MGSKTGGGFEDMGEIYQQGKCVRADEDGTMKLLSDLPNYHRGRYGYRPSNRSGNGALHKSRDFCEIPLRATRDMIESKAALARPMPARPWGCIAGQG